MKAMMNSIKNIDNRLVKVESNAAKNFAVRTFPTKKDDCKSRRLCPCCKHDEHETNVERGEKRQKGRAPTRFLGKILPIHHHHDRQTGVHRGTASQGLI